MMEANERIANRAAISEAKGSFQASDPRKTGLQLRPGLWQTINERYPGSMITKDSFVKLRSAKTERKRDGGGGE